MSLLTGSLEPRSVQSGLAFSRLPFVCRGRQLTQSRSMPYERALRTGQTRAHACSTTKRMAVHSGTTSLLLHYTTSRTRSSTMWACSASSQLKPSRNPASQGFEQGQPRGKYLKLLRKKDEGKQDAETQHIYHAGMNHDTNHEPRMPTQVYTHTHTPLLSQYKRRPTCVLAERARN